MSSSLYYSAVAPFEAARRIDVLPPGHRGRRLHGHGFVARVRAALPAGWAPFAGAETDALGAALASAVGGLDYQDLNAVLTVPSDAHLARWLRVRLGVPGLATVGVRSTPDQGVDLDAGEQMVAWRRFRFEAAHQLPKVPPGHPCGRMHGHGFAVSLHVRLGPEEPVPGAGYDELAARWAPLHAELDHACLNDLPGLSNPTSELLAHWLWQRLAPEWPALAWVSVYETATAGCHYDGRRYRIFKELRFEGALSLARAPAGDRRRRLHGHSYLVRLHLSAPLDAVLGWTIDYGDVKALFSPVYDRLDHHRLNDLPGLVDADPASLLAWLREAVGERLPALDRIDLQTTPGNGAILYWGEEQAALLE